MSDYSVNDNPMIFLNINGEKRWADAGWDPKKQQYWTLLPAKNLQDSAYPAGDGTEPDVQGHLATFDKDGKLLGVQAMHWGVEGGLDGFYPTEWPTKADSVYNANAAKTYAPQVFKQVNRQENGGNMNYSQYLQEGGAAEDQMGQVISQVIAALKQNPEETLKKLKEMGEQGDQLLEMAVQADPELQQMFSNTMKCGGKVKAKVKKKEVGGFVRKAGTGCACQLKKVGGRLIEVDGCTGLPVKRNGGIMKFETPAQGITYTDISGSSYAIGSDGQLHVKRGDGSYGPAISADTDNFYFGKYFYGKNKPVQGFYYNPTLKKFISVDRKFITAESGGKRVLVDASGNKYYDNGRMLNAKTGKMESYSPDVIENGWNSYWENTSTQKDQTSTESAATQNSAAAETGTPAGTGSATPEVPAAVQAWRANFGAGKSGKYGGLTYDEALARQREMAAAEGFNAAFGKQDGKWGSVTKGEWERYQTWKAEKEAAANKSAAGAGNETVVNPATVRTVETTAYMQNPKTNFQDSTNMTNQQLLNLNAVQAMTILDRPGYNRWMQLNNAKQHDTYAAGTYSAPMAVGDTYYNDEQSFNNARDAENLAVREAQLEALQSAKTNRQRRKINADYGKKINTATWNPRTYTINPVLNQDILSATTFTPAQRNGGILNYQDYLTLK